MENTNSSTDQSCIYDLLYSPCSLFEKLFKAFYKCLGGGAHDDHQDPKTEHVDTNSPSDESERQMKSTEDEFAVLKRRPQRPPVSSGGGGQIN